MTQSQNSTQAEGWQRLFESGWVYLEPESETAPAEVSRGMAILGQEGGEAGKVAAVIRDSHSQQVTHVLLSRPRLAPDYRLVPVDLIKGVNREAVLLYISSEAVDSLPARQVPLINLTDRGDK